MLIQTLLVAIAFLLHGEQWLLVDGFHQIKTIPSSFILSKINIGLLRSTSLTSLQLFPSPTAYSSPSNTMNRQYTSRIHRNKRRKSQTELRSSRGRANNSPNNDPDNPYYKGMDAYQILGIARTSKRDEIKKAYKKLVFQWHADRVPRDDKEKREEHEKRMKKINWAYWCLEDEERRQRYDKYGEAGVGTSETSEQQLKENGGPMPQGFGGFGGPGGGAVDLEGVDVGDLFEAFFGGGGGSPFGSSGFGGGRRAGASSARRNPNEPMEGEDLQIEHPIPFMTSIFGGSERLRVRRLEQCKTCSGSGVKPGAKIKTCSSCNGQGATMRIQRTPLGAIQSVQQCPTCRGTGQEIEEYCGTCRGKGTTVEMKEVDVRIPAGVDSGTTLRVREAGNAGKKGGRRGDLFVKITVRDDPRFKREGATIFTEEEISFTDAILGAVLKVETVDGKTEIRIPAGTQPDQKLRIRGKGVPQLGSADARGDQIITMKVRIPTKISDKEKELVQQLAQLSGGAK